LFTDVPNIATKVKRRKYLDLFLKQIKPMHKNTFSYLYWRTFLRKTEYSSLALRLSILGSLMLTFVDQWMISISLALLFTYLIGFQLLPMYSSYDYMQMTKLYPVSIKEKQRSMQQIIVIILNFIIGLFVIIGILTFKEKNKVLLLLLLLLIEEIFFAKWYMPKRFKKFR
jgi:ABC-2 type transport system permease protein